MRTKHFFICFVILFFFSRTIAQNNIDSFVLTLHNKDLKFIVGLILPNNKIDKSNGRNRPQYLGWFVTSLDFLDIEKRFQKYPFVKRLVEALDDPERDWSANLILFSIIQDQFMASAVRPLLIDSKEKWLMRSSESTPVTNKEMDVVMWRNYLSRLSQNSSYDDD